MYFIIGNEPDLRVSSCLINGGGWQQNTAVSTVLQVYFGSHPQFDCCRHLRYGYTNFVGTGNAVSHWCYFADITICRNVF